MLGQAWWLMPLGRGDRPSSGCKGAIRESRARQLIFRIGGLARKLDLTEMKRKMHEDMISIQNFLIYVALLRVTPFILKKLDSI
ncbi:mitochondrial import receptor subunit TOM5 homolog [Homo sapiens]|uniref:mitochondrial import receptor subunit TOM5 homolog n=1 Tax=Homo sapiens TaxID=9606 RepID=UPI001FB102B7|nr:mitochondrial import receptor subunit TOM5 homolog [Homo sapiens]XP_047273963.1 mitochondrial import receptor subunit TOM5 homolog [Homo sapiens]XP_047299273.1 mitochondrial import receptor subunit TOM5 homolog [Homo sapiens]XP_054185955.1 mitochondrial import receptor subunit TOM5 homolog [Homo sapiens]XP_054185956.1 mitochondrial import receptor subunit TOM5 homolog [Homo sapiens]XP_054209938.1 mitochondrial import receptor subunit TOM5 homolog [Homo sapiens]